MSVLASRGVSLEVKGHTQKPPLTAKECSLYTLCTQHTELTPQELLMAFKRLTFIKNKCIGFSILLSCCLALLCSVSS